MICECSHSEDKHDQLGDYAIYFKPCLDLSNGGWCSCRKFVPDNLRYLEMKVQEKENAKC